MPEQKKKNPADPDADQLNQDIVRIAHNTAFVRQPMILFLDGQLTWMECLEAMVLLMAKEYKEQNKILVETLRDIGPERTLMLTGGPLMKALPARPLDLGFAATINLVNEDEEDDGARLLY